jgi:HK97 family phage prohead protease
MQTKQTSLPLTLKKSDNPDFDATFIMSAATADRVQDTIDKKAYAKAIEGVDKLIALFNHDSDKIVGFWSDLKTKSDTLQGSIKFFHKDWGAMVKEMLEFGIPLGASIGFQGKGEWNDLGGIHFDEISLMETSIVATPAHPRAMQIAKSFGIDLSSMNISDADLLSASSGIDKCPDKIIRDAKLAILQVNKLNR